MQQLKFMIEHKHSKTECTAKCEVCKEDWYYDEMTRANLVDTDNGTVDIGNKLRCLPCRLEAELELNPLPPPPKQGRVQ